MSTKSSSAADDNNVLLFTEALNGVIYEIDLGYLDTLPEFGKSADDIRKEKDHVTVYNVTATNPKTQQFYMDVTLYEVVFRDKLSKLKLKFRITFISRT